MADGRITDEEADSALNNKDYVLQLDHALRAMGAYDAEVAALAGVLR